MSRLQTFFDNVAANFVSWILICVVCAVGAVVLAGFAAVTHGLSRTEQAVIVGLSAVVLMALVVVIYVGIRGHKLRASGVSATGDKPPKGVPLNAAELVWNWRRMVTNAHNVSREEKITFAEALVRDPSFPDLRPHLRKEARNAIEGLQLFTVPPGILGATDPLFNSVLEVVDRKEKEWGLLAEPQATSGGDAAIEPIASKVAVTIRDGVIASIPSLDNWNAAVQIFLRVAVVNNRLPKAKLYEWHLDLRDQKLTFPTFVSGSGSPAFRRLIPPRSTLMQPSQPQPAKPDRVDKWLDVVLRENALPPVCGENGWLMFQFSDLSLCHAFGHTYRLSVRDENGDTYYDEQSPGAWLEPVEVDWTGSGFVGVSVQGYGYSQP